MQHTRNWRDCKPALNFVGDSAWLSPNGTFYETECTEHCVLAEMLVKRDIEGCATTLAEYDPEHSLELTGWVKITDWAVVTYDASLVTQSQLDALWDWCARRNTTDIYYGWETITFDQFLVKLENRGRTK